MSYVYRHIRLDTGMPFYIGIGDDNRDFKRAKDVRLRTTYWKNIVKKYGHEVEIMLDGLTYDEAMVKEIEFIKLYGRLDIKTGILVNLTDGGAGTNGYKCSEEARRKCSERVTGNKHPSYGKTPSDETRRKISVANIGRVKSKEERAKLSAVLKGKKRTKEICEKISLYKLKYPILQYSMNGDFIREFKSVKEAISDTSGSAVSIYKCCLFMAISSGGFIWRYKSGVECPIKIHPRGKRSNDKRAVLKYSLDGEFIEEYDSCFKASILNNVSFGLIVTACSSRNRTGNGFVWVYKNNNEIKLKIPPYTRGVTSKIPVLKYSISGEFIQEYNCLSEAARSVGNKVTTDIANVCKGKTISCKGFKWKYK